MERALLSGWKGGSWKTPVSTGSRSGLKAEMPLQACKLTGYEGDVFPPE